VIGRAVFQGKEVAAHLFQGGNVKNLLIALGIALGQPEFVQTPIEEVVSLDAAIAKEKPVVVKFGAPWCNPCRKLEPFFVQWAANNPDANYVTINTDKAPQLTQDFKIVSIPKIVVIYKGKMIRLESNSEAAILQAIEALK
jgi:thioredoxin 1